MNLLLDELNFEHTDIATEGVLTDIFGALKNKIKIIRNSFSFDNFVYITARDKKVIKDYCIFMNAYSDNVNIFEYVGNNLKDIKRAFIEISDHCNNSKSDISQSYINSLLDTVKTKISESDAIYEKYNTKDLPNIVKITVGDIKLINGLANKSLYDTYLDNVIDFASSTVNKLNNINSKLAKPIIKLINTLLIPMVDKILSIPYHIALLSQLTYYGSFSNIEDVDTSNPWITLYDMPVHKEKLTSLALMYGRMYLYENKLSMPNGAIYVDKVNFPKLNKEMQKFILYHEYGHKISQSFSLKLRYSDRHLTAYYQEECLADLFACRIMGLSEADAAKYLHKIASLCVKFYKWNRAYMHSQLNTRARNIKLIYSKDNLLHSIDDIISLQGYTDVLEDLLK